MRGKACCFTGHRAIPPQERKRIAARLEQTITELIGAGVQNFLAGGALGFDTDAEKAVLRLREKYPHIRLILVLPCLSQTRGWRESDIQTYEVIKEQADEVVYTSQKYTQGCMFKRNRHLVDNSSICVCYLTRDRGGTAYTVRYAEGRGMKIINLAGKWDKGRFSCLKW